MALTTSFCAVLLEKATTKYGPADEVTIENVKLTMAAAIEELFGMVEKLTTDSAQLETMDTLDLEEDREEYEEWSGQPQDDSDSPNSQQISQEWELTKDDKHEYSIDVMKNVVTFYDNCKNKKLWRTSNRYRFVTSYQQISRFREYVEQNGRRMDKMKDVEEHVYSLFLDARTSLACDSERDLRRWGIKKAKEINLEFKASPYWLHLFKQRFRIVSRKITKLTTTKEIMNQQALMEEGNIFVQNVKIACEGVSSKNIMNFDQSGFNYEHGNERTLSKKGEKDTLMLVKSMNAVTHSYSIMPLLAMSGKLASKLLICLQELKGELGPRVASSLKIPRNIYLTSSRSGKLDKAIMRNWLESYVGMLSPDDEIVLILDSWAGQTDPTLYQGLTNLKSYHQIPPHTTQWKQPLDVYFFRQYKIIRRKFFDRSMLEVNEMDLKNRQSVLNMHSLIYNQLQSPLFAPMLQYCWYACGYTDIRPGHFMNVNELLFETDDSDCAVEDCSADCFIKCSHCREPFCLTHFLNDYHFHDID